MWCFVLILLTLGCVVVAYFAYQKHLEDERYARAQQEKANEQLRLQSNMTLSSTLKRQETSDVLQATALGQFRDHRLIQTLQRPTITDNNASCKPTSKCTNLLCRSGD